MAVFRQRPQGFVASRHHLGGNPPGDTSLPTAAEGTLTETDKESGKGGTERDLAGGRNDLPGSAEG